MLYLVMKTMKTDRYLSLTDYNFMKSSVIDRTVAAKSLDMSIDMNFNVQVVSLDNGYPHGVECMECNDPFTDGDVVLAGQKRLIGWIGWHTRCLKGILDDSPLDEFETTKQKLLNGEDPFE